MKAFLEKFQNWFDETTTAITKIILAFTTLSILCSIGLIFLPYIFQDRTPLAIRPDAPADKPNIIYIIIDALTAQDMGLYGYELPTTPELEEITKTWTVYENAISPVTCSIGYFPSIMTGRYAYHNSYPNYQIGKRIWKSSKWIDLSLLLKKAGYDTWWQGYLTPGLYHLGQGFSHIGLGENDIYGLRYWLQPYNRVISNGYFPYTPLFLGKLMPILMPSQNLKSFLKNTEKYQSPFFIYFHYAGVHGPGYPSGEKLGTFLPVEEGMTDRLEQLEVYGGYDLKYQDKVDKMHIRYDEAILKLDGELADMIEILKQKDLYDSSMIVITADHGQNFDNGFSSHCTPLLSYPETHVPMLVKYPNQAAGKRVDNMISAIDLTPTILDITMIEYDDEWFEGTSLLNVENEPTDRFVFSRNNSARYLAVIDSKWKYTQRNQAPFLFDYKNDPREYNNLFEQYKNDPEVISLEEKLNDYSDRISQILRGENP